MQKWRLRFTKWGTWIENFLDLWAKEFEDREKRKRQAVSEWVKRRKFVS